VGEVELVDGNLEGSTYLRGASRRILSGSDLGFAEAGPPRSDVLRRRSSTSRRCLLSSFFLNSSVARFL